MSMYFSRLLEMLLVTKPCVVVLAVCIGVGGCVCPNSSSDWCAGISSLQLMKSDPSSASAADDMTALMIFAIVNTAPLLVGNAVLFDMKKSPPDLLLIFFQIITMRRCGSLGPCHLRGM